MWKRWLFHATDFQSLMYPIFTVRRIIGMFPYKINASAFEISLLRYVLSTVVVCLYCVFCLLHLQKVTNFEILVNFDDVALAIEDIFYYTLSGSIAIATHILSNPQMHLLQTISEIYSKLSSESHQMLSRLIHTKDILGTILTVVELLIYIFTYDYENRWNVLIVVFVLYLDILRFQMNMLYVNCICVLKVCFKKINDDLLHMQSDMINDMKPSVFSLICHLRKNQFFLIEVKTLMKQHLMISRTVQELNLIFSLQLFATVMLIIFEMTFQLFFYLKFQRGIHLYFDSKLYKLLMSEMNYILQIVVIVWACETGKNQAQEIGTTVCTVFNTIRDEQIKEELKLFSLQILHHRNTFLVKGLTVDATLLASIVGSIATCMVILIQFLIMVPCNETSIINK